MNTEALKEQARRHEQREEWQKALDLYGQAVHRLAEDDQPDLALYNRLGDLEIRVGNVERAIEHYEQAIDLYLESELPNNAIAICRKIVRNLPTRHHIYLKMGQIRAKQGFLTDARQNFLEYAERMQKAEDMEEAFRALIEFVELAPDDVQARSALAAQLEAHDRTAEAVEQYIAVHQQLTLDGSEDAAAEVAAKISELDPAAVIPPPHADDDDAMGFETTSLVADFPVFETEITEGPTQGAEAQLGEIEIGADEEEGVVGTESLIGEADEAHEEGFELEHTVASGSFTGSEATRLDPEAEPANEGFVESAGEERASQETLEPEFAAVEETAYGFEDLGEDLALAEEETDAEAPEPTADLLFGESPDLAEAEAEAELTVDAAASWEGAWNDGDSATEMEGAEDLLVGSSEDQELEDLPLLTFDDEVSDVGAEGLSGADFGVRDDDWQADSDYVESTADVPELEADLAQLELEDAAPEDLGEETLGLMALEDNEESPLEQALREEESAPESTLEPVADEAWVEEESAEEEAAEPVLAEEDRVLEEALREEEPAPATEEGGKDLVVALQERLEQDPDDPDTWLTLAQEFYRRERGIEAGLALEQAIQAFQGLDDLGGSIRAVETLATHEPDRIEHHQRLVELAIRSNDSGVITPAYLGLAACLLRGGDEARARGVYEQVLMSEPDNQAARESLEALAGSEAPVLEVASSEDYVDLGSMVLDVEEERTTRWKVPAAEPSGDEEADFAKMLSQFKEKVAENLEADDLAAHYDLGTAYKEMGLVDEAISEFQQALRAQADHLPTHELLGQCFMETEQYEVAVRSMNRAVDADTEVEDELLGIYYQLARAHEELGNKDDALEFYEKVFALDINFQDVTERLRVLR